MNRVLLCIDVTRIVRISRGNAFAQIAQSPFDTADCRRIDQWDNTSIHRAIVVRDDDDGNNDNDPFSKMRSVTTARASELRSCEYGVTQALSHMCVCYVYICIHVFTFCVYVWHYIHICASSSLENITRRGE